jgi:hypothetical protein
LSQVRERGPDFLVIGQQKGGTSWLYRELDRSPAFAMPPLKEFGYWDDMVDHGRPVYLRSQVDLAWAWKRRARRRRRVPFLLRARLPHGTGPNLAWYERLLPPPGDRPRGEVSPDYSRLPAEAVGALAGHYPRLRNVLLVRDPVTRLWSHWTMYALRNSPRFEPITAALGTRPRAKDLEDLDLIARFIDVPLVSMLSSPTGIHERWARAFGEDQVHVAFYDDLAGDPVGFFRGIAEWLLDGTAPDHPVDSEPTNESRGGALPDAVRDLLSERFAAERRACAERFGGPATTWGVS